MASNDFMPVSKVAEKWGISERRIQVLCGEGRIDGAERPESAGSQSGREGGGVLFLNAHVEEAVREEFRELRHAAAGGHGRGDADYSGIGSGR